MEFKNLFKGKKVVVMGLGLHGGGAGVAEFFAKNKAKVLVTDLKTKEQLKESVDKLAKFKNIEFALSGHREEDFEAADLIIKNPDVPNSSKFLEIARKNNIPIETDISLFFKYSGAYIIGITGTKGKSTTAAIIYHLLKAKYPRVFLAGNIGVSPLKLISKVKKRDIVVLELSSFELEDLKQSPQIAVITNIMPDHLNRYNKMGDYISAKKIIFKYQKKSDFLILNYDDVKTRNFEKEAKSNIYFYSSKEKPRKTGCYLKSENIYCQERKNSTINLDDFNLFGEHNISNLLAAVSTVKILNLSCNDIKKNIKKFKGVHSRQEFVKEINGVKYFNDTTATMPEAVIKAAITFRNRFPESKLIFISGGQDKNLDFDKMADIIAKKINFLILLPGTGSEKIKIKIKNRIKIFNVLSMEQAVKKAKEIGKKGDIVALSPGAASFNLFKNEFDRGSQFVRAVKNI